MENNMEFVSVKAYDGSIVRINKDDLPKFIENQEKIKMWQEQGLSIEEIQKKLQGK